MPLTKYCPSCAFPNLYTLETPIFCSSCGAKFDGSISVANKKPKPKLVNYPKIKELELDTNDNFDDLNDGESLSENEETPKVHKLFGQTSKKSRKIRQEDEDDGANIDDLNINALELDIPISIQKEKGVTLGQVIKEQKTGFERPKPKRVNKKAEMEKFKLEAGAGGRKDISIEDKGLE